MNNFYPIKKRALSEILSSESAWVRGKSACDANGSAIPPESSDACQWCLLGAYYASRDRYVANWEKLVKVVARVAGRHGINEYEPVGFNDNPAVTFPMIQEVIKEYEKELE